ncbi:MAG: DEAD/DEAH box helicase [Acidobacteria bacterium]|nr:DEAD/DEAH box helicase [Acidobacteriota bacterium]
MSFESFGLDPALLRGLEDVGFSQPTPIQEQSIPPALAGRDLLASAKTGSGKTAAFLLPILHQLLGQPRGKTRALIVTPTRELAIQIDEQFSMLAYHTPLTGAAVYGGVGMIPQARAFEAGADVIVATPGRLLDHLRFPYGSLADVETLVLDEADRMLDMGFLPDVRRILRQLPARRQTLFFSATMPPPIVKLTRELLREPVTINIGQKVKPAEGVTHTIFPVSQEQKTALLLELLRRPDIDRALTFTRTRQRADRLAGLLERHGVPVGLIHGDRSQSERNEALSRFKQRKIRVLVATDVAARGIDIERISHVVNFDVPKQAEDYVHRVGRTARAECTGDAFTFVSPGEEQDMRSIERAIGLRLARTNLAGFDHEQPVAAAGAPRRARRSPGRPRHARR